MYSSLYLYRQEENGVELFFITDKIIDLLKLDCKYDEKSIDLGNTKELDIPELGMIIIGGFLLIAHFPIFVYHSGLVIENAFLDHSINKILDPNSLDYREVEYTVLVYSTINVVISFLVLSNYARVAQWFFKQKKTLKNDSK